MEYMNMELDLVISKSEIIKLLGKWMYLDIIIMGKRTQIQKDKCFMLLLICSY